MIEAIQGKGVNRARAICDLCGRDETVACGYIRTTPQSSEPNKGQIIKKLAAQGWVEVKGRLYCPTCEAKRKIENHHQKECDMAVETKDKLREPTPKQKREIIGMLEIVYDDERKRFRDGESDKTVAEAIGGGVLWGWVAAVREELFGPDTRNQEIEAIRESIKGVDERIEAISAEVTRLKRAMDDLQQTAAGIKGKLDKVSA